MESAEFLGNICEKDVIFSRTAHSEDLKQLLIGHSGHSKRESLKLFFDIFKMKMNHR